MLRALGHAARRQGRAPAALAEALAPAAARAADPAAADADADAPGPSGRTAARFATLGRPGAGSSGRGSRQTWDVLKQQGFEVNPCNSPLHPAFTEAGIAVDADHPELPVQEAYTPESACFGCGPAAPAGLHVRSFRRPGGGLEAAVELDAQYCAFPGIVQGGIVSALFDCHGNWTAAIALMDRNCLPKPPLTLTAELLVTFVEPTPPGAPLVLRSEVASVSEPEALGAKAAVQVDMTLHAAGPGGALLARASGIFKKLGALRAL